MKFKRLIAVILASFMLTNVLPLSVLADLVPTVDHSVYELSDGAIKVAVSGKNGGFVIRTEEGDSLIKSDNNKDILFHSEDYDTSFTSFRVTDQDGSVKDYLFGGDYGFLGMASSEVVTTKDDTGITSVWSVDALTFTQRIELAGAGANEHGAVLITYKAENASEKAVDIKARVLLDTALGSKDYAHYEVVNEHNEYRSISAETVLTQADYIPSNFFGYDDINNPSITAYHIHIGEKPYQMAFGHWNSLASTLFDYAPNDTVTFTSVYNEAYLTADSAVGMYFDMGSISKTTTENNTFTTYYGVYSNNAVTASDSIAINVSSPATLTLSEDKKTYLPEKPGLENGDFEVQAQLNNFVSDTAKDFGRVTVAVYTSAGITPYDTNGNLSDVTATYLEPFTMDYVDFKIGQTQTTSFKFKADVGAVSEFRKIELRAFDTTEDVTLTADRIIGTKSFYVLCPGGDGKLPEVLFTQMKPEIVYNSGQRNLYIAGKNFSMLIDESMYDVRAYQTSGNKVYDIPDSQVEFSVENGVDTMTVMLTETMETGAYELVLDFIGEPPAGLKKRLTAPALKFTVSDDKQYKNNYYGIVAVVQDGTSGDSVYDIRLYKTEEQFNKDKGNYEEVLITLKGDFEETEVDGNVVYKATSVKSGGKSENVVVVNDCIDFENGVLKVYKNTKDVGGVVVEFDGDIYTSVKRSKIWSGEATFTELRNGVEYGLVPYNNDGERMEGDYGEEITLLWPCGLGIAQTISGMAFNMTFGSLGIVYDTDSKKLSSVNSSTKVEGRVISFSASLDLSFLVPNAGRSAKDTNWASLEVSFGKEMTSTELRNKWTGMNMLNHSYNGTSYKDNRSKEGQGSVMVDDILYGCGKGLMGVNFTVELVLPGYFEAMPTVAGKLSINTISGYELGVDGVCQFGTLEVETSIAIKDYNGKPIPDKLYFAIMGFEPGINIDGFGVLWLTGGGGGIDKLYDTIFGGSSIPPLKILLTVSFDIMKVLAAKVDLSLSLRGLSLTARDVRVKYFDLKVLNRLQLAFEWYPEFYFMASVDANILQIIRGQGYIVIMKNDEYDAFVEFFVRASVQIPDSIPIIGGIDIGGADLGANNEKIWGVARALGAEIGVTYYWGGNVDFGTGSAISKPSFPSLLGYEDVPVYYDEENDRTLYMRAGSNVALAAQAVIAGEEADEPKLFNLGRSIESKASRLEHRITLGAFDGIDAALVASFAAESKEQAMESARQIQIAGYPLVLYDPALQNADSANTNLVYNAETKTASLNIVFSKAEEFNKVYTMTTPIEASLAMYDINPMPEMTVTNAVLTGNTLKVDWTGTSLGELDKAMFMLTTDPNGSVDSDVYPIHSVSYLPMENAEITLPGDLPSGTYYLKTVYSKEDFVNEQRMLATPIVYTNPNQPTAPKSVIATNGGSFMFDLTIEKEDQTDFDGYSVNVYTNEIIEGTPEYTLTDMSGLTFEKNADGSFPKLEVGGYFTIPDVDENGNEIGTKMVGLAPEKEYRIGVTAYKNLTNATGEIVGKVGSKEILSDWVTLKTPTPPTVKVTNNTSFQTLYRTQIGIDEPIAYDTFAQKDVSFTLLSDVPVTGAWTLNDSLTGTFASGENIAFSDLDDGDYTLTFTGEDADGDTFIVTKLFAVDTLPPVLLVTSPINGAFFGADGTITLSGVTDPEARLTILVDDEIISQNKTISEIGGTIGSDGVFTVNVQGDPSVSTQKVSVQAFDLMQNASNQASAYLYNQGFAQIESLTVYADGRAYTNGNIPTADGFTAELSVGVDTPSGTFLLDSDSPVDWTVVTAIGNAAVDAENIFTAAAGSMGTLTANFYVADIDEKAAAEGYVPAMQATVTFGAESNLALDEFREVIVTAAPGGSATGGGFYGIGASVTLTASVDKGYKFDSWLVKSGTVLLNDPKAETITFVMPAEPVEIEAVFKKPEKYIINSYDYREPKQEIVESEPEILGIEGKLYDFEIPEGENARDLVPYYKTNGETMYVRMSAELDGKLYFIAPEDATYRLVKREISFRDIDTHWAKDYILYAASRSIFNGISDTHFAPDDSMTRGMFVTVLGRLSGIPIDENATSDFTDVPDGEWYTPFVAWAAENGIVNGYGNDLFGADDLVSREQMCAILKRYLDAFGYTLEKTEEEATFADGDDIDDWAKESVSFCQTTGLIKGKGDDRFAPKDHSTRAEVATIMARLITAILASAK